MPDPVITTTYEVDESGFTIVETPDQPVPVRTHHPIRELRELKRTYRNARQNCLDKAAEWKAKLDAVQALIDLYNANGGAPE